MAAEHGTLGPRSGALLLLQPVLPSGYRAVVPGGTTDMGLISWYLVCMAIHRIGYLNSMLFSVF